MRALVVQQPEVVRVRAHAVDLAPELDAVLVDHLLSGQAAEVVGVLRPSGLRLLVCGHVLRDAGVVQRPGMALLCAPYGVPGSKALHVAPGPGVPGASGEDASQRECHDEDERDGAGGHSGAVLDDLLDLESDEGSHCLLPIS